MPFASDKQRRYLWSQKPEVARKFAEHKQTGGPIAPLAPLTQTGVPAGGFAAPAIQEYLAGPASPTQLGHGITTGDVIRYKPGPIDISTPTAPPPVGETIVEGVGPSGDQQVIQGSPVSAPTRFDQAVQDSLVKPVGELYADKIQNTPFDINPPTTTTAYGDEFTYGPGVAVGAALPPGLGALATVGGIASKTNLDRIAEKHGTYGAVNEGMGVIPKDTIPGVTTPLAVSGGIFDGSTVISGNTDLAIQQNPGLDINKDGTLTSAELQEYMAASTPEAQASIAAQQQVEQNKQKAMQAQAAYENDLQAQIAQHDGGDSGHVGGFVGGSVVTDSQGNAVKDKDGHAVTSGGTFVSSSDNDDGGGGGGGGGRWCCSVMVHAGLWSEQREFARMTAWSLRKFGPSNPWWLSGYNVWGKVVAKHIVKPYGWGKDLLQAFYDYHVEGKQYTWRTLAAQAIIFPGSFIAGHVYSEIPTTARLATPGEI